MKRHPLLIALLGLLASMPVRAGEAQVTTATLEPGAYEVAVELQGFQKTRRPDVRLSVGQSLTLNVTIGVGRIEDVVTVSGESPIINTTTSSVSSVVDAQQIEVFNLLNRANFGLPAATVFDASGRVPNAGEITTTVGTARQVQLGVKFEF